MGIILVFGLVFTLLFSIFMMVKREKNPVAFKLFGFLTLICLMFFLWVSINACFYWISDKKTGNDLAEKREELISVKVYDTNWILEVTEFNNKIEYNHNNYSNPWDVKDIYYYSVDTIDLNDYISIQEVK